MNWILFPVGIMIGLIIGLILSIIIAKMVADVHEEEEYNKYLRKKK